MESTLKLLQCTKFLYVHTLVIGVKLLKELGDKVRGKKSMCPGNQTIAMAPKHIRPAPTPMIMVN
jgi:hypothetical protein